jgi:hypothetical protein
MPRPVHDNMFVIFEILDAPFIVRNQWLKLKFFLKKLHRSPAKKLKLITGFFDQLSNESTNLFG